MTPDDRALIEQLRADAGGQLVRLRATAPEELRNASGSASLYVRTPSGMAVHHTTARRLERIGALRPMRRRGLETIYATYFVDVPTTRAERRAAGVCADCGATRCPESRFRCCRCMEENRYRQRRSERWTGQSGRRPIDHSQHGPSRHPQISPGKSRTPRADDVASNLAEPTPDFGLGRSDLAEEEPAR